MEILLERHLVLGIEKSGEEMERGELYTTGGRLRRWLMSKFEAQFTLMNKELVNS